MRARRNVLLVKMILKKHKIIFNFNFKKYSFQCGEYRWSVKQFERHFSFNKTNIYLKLTCPNYKFALSILNCILSSVDEPSSIKYSTECFIFTCMAYVRFCLYVWWHKSQTNFLPQFFMCVFRYLIFVYFTLHTGQKKRSLPARSIPYVCSFSS